MKTVDLLKVEIAIANFHAERIEKALRHTQHLLPIQPFYIDKLKDEELGFLELLTSRFAKLQDCIGQKIFPLILTLLQEDIQGKSFLDCLNKLEKLEIIPNTDFWLKFREVRNILTHEYPDNPTLLANNLNKAFDYAQDLLKYWQGLKIYITNNPLISN